jgi:DNA-binding transcriptional ArsR family regulator
MPEPLHADALDALGDANRRAIVEILSGGAQPVGEIAARLPISRPAVSRHLRLLKRAGLVSDEAQGTRRVYALREDGVEAVRAYFAQVWDEAATRFALLADNTDER